MQLLHLWRSRVGRLVRAVQAFSSFRGEMHVTFG